MLLLVKWIVQIVEIVLFSTNHVVIYNDFIAQGRKEYVDYSANKQIWKRDLLVDFSANWQIWNEKRIDWLLYLKPTLFITVFVIQQRLNLSQKCLILKPKFLSRINCSKCHWSCGTCSTDSFNSCVYLQKAAFMCKKKHINVNCVINVGCNILYKTGVIWWFVTQTLFVYWGFRILCNTTFKASILAF